MSQVLSIRRAIGVNYGEAARIVTYNMASLDGRITLAPDVLLLHGHARWEVIAGSGTADEAYALMKRLHEPQVILEGSGSFVAPDAEPPPLPEAPAARDHLFTDFLPPDIVDEGRGGFFTVVDSRGRIRWAYKEFPGEEWLGWHLLVLVARGTPPSYPAYLRAENIPYLVGGEASVNLHIALERMGERLGVRTVVSTAGGRLNGALLREGLVDEIDVEFLPAVIGGRGTPALFDAPPLGPDEHPVRLSPITVDLRPNGHLFLRYGVVPG